MSIIEAIYEAAFRDDVPFPDRICVHPRVYYDMCMEPRAQRVITPPQGDEPATFHGTVLDISTQHSETGFAFEQRDARRWHRVYTSDDWNSGGKVVGACV